MQEEAESQMKKTLPDVSGKSQRLGRLGHVRGLDSQKESKDCARGLRKLGWMERENLHRTPVKHSFSKHAPLIFQMEILLNPQWTFKG